MTRAFGEKKEKKEEEPRSAMCKAHGCPCAGGIGGICRFHFGAEFMDWPHISEGLRGHIWLMEVIRWVRDDSYRYPFPKIIERLQNTAKFDDAEELRPKENELPARWVIRAESWMRNRICGVKK